MPIDERLQRAASDLKAEMSRVPIPDPPAAPVRLGLALVTGVVLVAVILALPLVPGRSPDPAPPLVSEPEPSTTSQLPTTTSQLPTTTSQLPTTTGPSANLPNEGPIFGEETGVLILMDNGLESLTAVDPDGRVASRSLVEGQRPGDEPYSMIRVGNKLVVGWGEPHAVDIVTREAISLGTATIFVPAAEPNRVWMVDSGPRIGSRPTEVWQVDVITGEALQDPVPLNSEGLARMGIQGGLALQTDSGLSLWSLESGQAVSVESSGPGFFLDVFENELVWCDDSCRGLAVTRTDTLETMRYDPPDGYETFDDVGSYSPDGRYLAALVGHEGMPEGRAIWILDRDTGEIDVVSDPDTIVSHLAWAPDSDQLFATSNSYGEFLTTVWRYQISDQEFAGIVLPFGGAITPVVIDRSLGGAYLDGESVEIEECRFSASVCTFDY